MGVLLNIFLSCFLGQALAAYEVPPFTPNVVDVTGTLNQREIGELNGTLARLHQERIRAVVLLAPLQGTSIEQAADATFRRWKFSDPGADNGLLILVAPKERRMRIQFGGGLAPALTDEKCVDIIDRILRPAFRSQKFSTGIQDALEALAQHIRRHAKQKVPAASP